MDEAPSTKRRLAAILAADIAGYSRLMGENEDATVRDLKGHQAVILPLIGHYGGRIIDTAGDGILAEFPSVIGAAECAIEIQTVMATRNSGVPEHRRMLFRIGLNLGDVIHDETRIYGDGITVAVRTPTLPCATPRSRRWGGSAALRLFPSWCRRSRIPGQAALPSGPWETWVPLLVAPSPP
jgi:hypothetical protein